MNLSPLSFSLSLHLNLIPLPFQLFTNQLSISLFLSLYTMHFPNQMFIPYFTLLTLFFIYLLFLLPIIHRSTSPCPFFPNPNMCWSYYTLGLLTADIYWQWFHCCYVTLNPADAPTEKERDHNTTSVQYLSCVYIPDTIHQTPNKFSKHLKLDNGI